jgi:ATP-dependent Clp protease adaptor protein ClpS
MKPVSLDGFFNVKQRDMATNTKRKTAEASQELVSETNEQYVLVLCNDDINSFEYVMLTLVSICKHTKEQAEQCAMITHYKGKCDIKIGAFEELVKIKRILIDKGLTVIVEKL